MLGFAWLSSFVPFLLISSCLANTTSSSSSAPVTYKKQQIVPVQVNALTSELLGMSHDFYDERFGFCRPSEIVQQHESLGAILFGDRIKNSPIQVKMAMNETNIVLCHAKLSKEQANFIRDKIEDEFRQNWLIDSFPITAIDSIDNVKDSAFATLIGDFALGDSTQKDGLHLYNHYHFVLQYHEETLTQDFQLVGAFVIPESNASTLQKTEDDASGKSVATLNKGAGPLILQADKPIDVVYSYDVTWIKSEITWSMRWDNYMKMRNTRVRWFSIINSSIAVLFLSAVVAMILIRTLHKDIDRYNQMDHEDLQEDFGWKLVHGDVFRTPGKGMLLGILVGSGYQIFATTFLTLLFATLGFLSPANRGSMLTTMLALYVIFSSLSGYVSAIFFKMIGGESWKKNVLLTSFLVPGIFIGIFIILNFFLIGAGSSNAVPFSAFFNLFFLWVAISFPLGFFGAFRGFRRPRLSHPVRTNQIPRQVPEQPYYYKILPTVLICGILPFAAMLAELYSIMGSIWSHKVYYVFGFLFLVFIILVLTSAEVSVIMCYFRLCSEDYRWWWRSFITGGSASIYVFIYSIYFYARSSISHFASTMLFFGYVSIFCLALFLMTGAIGFTASFVFVRRIYGSIKTD